MPNQLSQTVVLETHPGISPSLSVETDMRPHETLTTVVDKASGGTVATVSQKLDSKDEVRFLQAKGGFFAIVNTGNLTYLALPGSKIRLGDTELTMAGNLPPGRMNPVSKAEIPNSPQQVTDQAMILGAGIASRFVPVSGDLTGYAKPSVPLVGEDSVIVTLARHMQRHGIRRILVNTYYMPGILKEQLQKITDLEFVFIDEAEPSGTAGGLLKALEQGLVDRSKPMLVMQGDAVTDGDLTGLLNTHAQKSPPALATIGVKYVTDEEVSQMAIVVTDRSGGDGESGYASLFQEKPTLDQAGSNRLASIGFYILAPETFDDFVALGKKQWEQGPEFDYAYHFFPFLLSRKPQAIYAHMIPQPFYWSDIGRPDQYIETVRDVYAGKLQVPLPPDAERYFRDGIIFWEDAQDKAREEGAVLEGNLVVFKRRF